MNRRVVLSVLMAVMFVSVATAYSFPMLSSYSLRATGGDLLNIAHFNNFNVEKVSVSTNGRVGNWSNYDFVGSGGFDVLGVTPSGNRVSVKMNGDLLYYTDSATQQIAGYDGYATFKSGSLTPTRYYCQIETTWDKTSNLMDVDAFCNYFGGFRVQDMSVVSLS